MIIVHGDAHVWNLFLPQAVGSDDIRFFDWDTWRLGIATRDLAYMMALHWFPEHRRGAERRLLDHYHAVLLAHGVAGYDRRALDGGLPSLGAVAIDDGGMAGVLRHPALDSVEPSGANLRRLRRSRLL